jgi:hypothetical protein
LFQKRLKILDVDCASLSILIGLVEQLIVDDESVAARNLEALK